MSAKRRVSIGIVAPSSVTPPTELELGLEKLRDAGYSVKTHSQVRKRHLFFAGDDRARAIAFYEAAIDGSTRVLWAARGGYGANHLLPWLERMTAERGIPERKLFVGYSDSTCLMEFVRRRWSWPTLHGAMPGLREFWLMKATDWKALRACVEGEAPRLPWGARKLRFYGHAPAAPLEAELVGGNLSGWISMLGTRFAPNPRGKLIFFEDVTETPSRIDRMVQHLLLAGGLEGAAGVVLGKFHQCEDGVSRVLKRTPPPGASRERIVRSPKPSELQPLRPVVKPDRALREIFGSLSECYRIPVAYGLPVGHGPEKAPLPLGARYRLSPSGALELVEWGWRG